MRAPLPCARAGSEGRIPCDPSERPFPASPARLRMGTVGVGMGQGHRRNSPDRGVRLPMLGSVTTATQKSEARVGASYPSWEPCGRPDSTADVPEVGVPVVVSEAVVGAEV